MSNSPKALIIVEGAHAESRLFEKMAESFGLDVEIVVYGTNIYDLYRRLHDDAEADDGAGGFLNIKDVLLEMTDDEAEKAKLNGDFAYTYLVFDFDIQHHQKDDGLNIDARVVRNMPMLKWMAERFTDETDDTSGKLYINYPMVEAYRDADAFFDNLYAERKIRLDDISKYKHLVASKRLSGYDVAKCGVDQVEALLKMAVFKLSVVIGQGWTRMPYEEYMKKSKTGLILNRQESFIVCSRDLFVINTSLFLPIDYKGNALGFYDQVVGQ